MEKRYTDLNTYFRNMYGCRVQKITVDAGLSCPNRDGRISRGGCIYCNAKGSGTGAHQKGLSITEQLINGKTALSRRYKAKKFIAYFQSFSNTYAPVEKLASLYEEALSIDDVVGLSIGTRPDCVNEEVICLLEKYTKDFLVWIEYGLQSVHDATLDFINRGHGFDCFRQSVELTKNRGINICAHIIIGLPGENREHILKTAEKLAVMGIDGVKIHLLYVVRGTKMEQLYNAGEYHCLDQQQYADLVCDVIERLPANLVIQRLTGDPHPEELVAPMWSLNKNQTLSMINGTLEKENRWQGKLFR